VKWSLTVREEYRPRVFENGALKRIFGPKTKAVTPGSRNLCKMKKIENAAKKKILTS
jgi:hypothetical protein